MPATDDRAGREPRADYGIVTALRDELNALRAALSGVEEVQLGTADIRYYYRGRLACRDGSQVTVVCVCSNEMGQLPALNATRDLIAGWKPMHILLVGIAGGFPGRGGSYGDVVVPLRVHYYEPGKLVATSAGPDGRKRTRLPRWRTFTTSAKLSSAVEALAVEGAEWVRRVSVQRPDATEQKPRVLRDELASGEEVWASLDSPMAREVLATSDKILAVENEASGFLGAVLESAYPPDALVVKAISDLVAGKDDRWRAFAASAAAAFAVAVIEKLGARWRSGEGADLATAGDERLAAARKAVAAEEYDLAGRLAEEAAELAKTANDPGLERRCRHQAVRAWGEHVAMSRLGRRAFEEIVSRIRVHIQALEGLDMQPHHLALEKARLALFEENGAEALQWARSALTAAEEGTHDWVDALIFCAQAHWVLGTPEEALDLAHLMETARTKGDPETRLVSSVTWLRTLYKAGKAALQDLNAFCDLTRALVKDGLDRRRAASLLGQLDSELVRQRRASIERLTLCELGMELAEQVDDATRAASIALEGAELAADCGQPSKARRYLGTASGWLDRARTSPKEPADGGASWATLRAVHLFGRGRIFFRLAVQDSAGGAHAAGLLHEAMSALEEAEAVATEERLALRGDVEIFLADVRWWRARAAFEMHRWAQAAALARSVRSDAAMAHPQFSVEVGMHAWLLEAEALYHAGASRQAAEVVEALLADPRAGSTAGTQAKSLRRHLTARIQPLFDWTTSPDARAIAVAAKGMSLRDAVGMQLRPLVTWWDEWTKAGQGPHSEFFDFWGRGGFSRVAAAIRARPNAAIAVDARSIDEIRRWARVFCPLFDTVVVKWKGDIAQGMVIVPMDLDYGGPGSYGGHGYTVTAGTEVKSPTGRDWTVALGWANPLPSEVASFLATEAVRLVASGRLLVVPAPLVGCTQTAVGWTDHLLVDGLLGGVVDVIGKERDTETIGGQRVLDLSKLSIPYVDGVPLAELADVLETMSEWLHPLRSLLFRSLLGEQLRHERWEAIRALESDFEDACRQLRERLTGIARQREWSVAEAPGSVSAASRGSDVVGREPVTDLLRAVTPVAQELTPWIPYWRLQNAGGRLDWTCPLDNPSRPSEKPTVPREIQTWIWPGTGGWTIPSAVRLPL